LDRLIVETRNLDGKLDALYCTGRAGGGEGGCGMRWQLVRPGGKVEGVRKILWEIEPGRVRSEMGPQKIVKTGLECELAERVCTKPEHENSLFKTKSGDETMKELIA